MAKKVALLNFRPVMSPIENRWHHRISLTQSSSHSTVNAWHPFQRLCTSVHFTITPSLVSEVAHGKRLALSLSPHWRIPSSKQSHVSSIVFAQTATLIFFKQKEEEKSLINGARLLDMELLNSKRGRVFRRQNALRQNQHWCDLFTSRLEKW